MQEICSPNPLVVTGLCDSNKSRARHHRTLKFGSKLNISRQYKLSPNVWMLRCYPQALIKGILLEVFKIRTLSNSKEGKKHNLFSFIYLKLISLIPSFVWTIHVMANIKICIRIQDRDIQLWITIHFSNVPFHYLGYPYTNLSQISNNLRQYWKPFLRDSNEWLWVVGSNLVAVT